MNNKILILLAFLSFTFMSCEKAFFDEEQRSDDAVENFEYLWKECKDKYTFFETKDIDWDKVKEEYSSKVYDGMPRKELFDVLAAMLNELKDGHVNLISDFDISHYRVSQLGQDNYDARIVFDNYIAPGDYQNIGNFQCAFLADKQLGYVKYDGFSGRIGEHELNLMISKFKDTKGLIFDIRENGGGSTTELFNVLSRFVDKEQAINYSRTKIGPEKDDFSELVEVRISPYELEGDIPSTSFLYTKNVAVLTDRGTYSAGSFFSLATISIPHMIRIGDTTGGGLGLPNGGQLPNGWTYRFSVTQSLTLEDKIDYENGVPPDYNVQIDWNDRTKDEIIDFAIEKLLQ